MRALPSTGRAIPLIEPVLMIQSFYPHGQRDSSFARGCDPDQPPHLAKVTETL